MLALYSRSLRHNSSLASTAATTAANISATGLLGRLVFGEVRAGIVMLRKGGWQLVNCSAAGELVCRCTASSVHGLDSLSAAGCPRTLPACPCGALPSALPAAGHQLAVVGWRGDHLAGQLADQPLPEAAASSGSSAAACRRQGGTGGTGRRGGGRRAGGGGGAARCRAAAHAPRLSSSPGAEPG